MSWLSAVTGKAEDLLNKLDKSAADAFHIEEETPSRKPVTLSPLASAGQPSQPAFPSSKPLSPSASVPTRLSDTSRFGQPTTTSTPKPTAKASGLSSTVSAVKTAGAGPGASSSKPAGAVVKKKDSDEALFDFLNSKEPSEGGKKRVTPISSRHHSRQSSTSSLRGSGKAPEGGDELPGGGGSGGAGAVAGAAQAPATVSTGESFVKHC